MITSQRVEITRKVDESKLEYYGSIELMNGLGMRVQDKRKREIELSGKFEVEKELLAANKTVIDRKSREASQAILEIEKYTSFDSEKSSICKRKITAIEQTLDALRSELREILDKISSFMDRRTVVYQRLEQLNSVLFANQARLKAATAKLDLTIDNTQKRSAELRNLREREYASLNILKAAQLDLTRIETNRVHISKKQIAARAWLDSASERLAILQVERNRGSEDLDSVRQACVVIEKSSSRLTDHCEELELTHFKIQKQMRGSLSNSNDAETLNQNLIRELNTLRQNSSDCLEEIDGKRELLDVLAAAATKSVPLLDEFRNHNRSLREAFSALEQNLHRIKRINVDKRFCPILIDSESHLMDRLQINPFLRRCQSQSRPLPPIIDKIADILGALEGARNRADERFITLGMCNSRINASRESRAEFQELLMRLKTFKTNALVNYLENLLSNTSNNQVPQEAIFDLIDLGPEELTLIGRTIKRLSIEDKLQRLSFCECSLDGNCLPRLTGIISSCPYLARLQLSRNAFGSTHVTALREFLVSIDGITGVSEEVLDSECELGLRKSGYSGAVLLAHSGRMIRLRVEFLFQLTYMSIEQPPSKPKTQKCTKAETGQVVDTAIRNVPPVSEQVKPTAMRNPDMTFETLSSKQSMKNTFASSESVCSDQSFKRQLQISRRNIIAKAYRLGIKQLVPVATDTLN